MKANIDIESDLDIDVHMLVHTHTDAIGERCVPQHHEKGIRSFCHVRIR